MIALTLALLLPVLNVAPPEGQMETVVLRFLHIVFGILWIGLLYFLNLVNAPTMKELDAGTKVKVVSVMMPRLMWWFRWSSVIVWLAGLRYFMILAKTDASNAGDPALMWKWLGIWFGVWVVAFVVLYGLVMATPTSFGNKGAVLAVTTTLVVAGTSWLVLNLLAHPGAGNRTLSIAIGGGMGTIMFLNVWGIIWRCQKQLIGWARLTAQDGLPAPSAAEKLQRIVFLTSRMNFWMSFPMLFFMVASAHFEFLMGI